MQIFLFSLIPFPSILIFSLITYKMRKEIYEAWWHFSSLWLMISIPLILILPDGGGPFVAIGKGVVPLLSLTLFPFLSFIIVFGMLLRGKKK